MALLGTVVNAFAVVLGSLLGLILPRLREEMRTQVMQGVGLVVTVMGLSMAMRSENIIVILVSLVLGGVVGGWLHLDEQLKRFGRWMEERFGNKEGFASGFITATLVFCVGPMAVLGALAGGLKGEHELLFTKAMLDGFTAIIFTSSLGVGVLFSAVPIFLYQGVIALSAEWIIRLFQGPLLDRILEDLTAVGGIMIIAIGLNLLNLTRIRVADWLPALPVAVVAAAVYDAIPFL
ncbi:hypothetical protein CLV97_103143 [Planifilum fimeticola]|jgi:uncharacterized membrane protein YqgA involved in biofilm formation|uniref:Membrane protein YdfK n=1 Tax=Planifilum fimeticola TaxID=201975 RepID=A0A2T0LI87_9BACL|nr:DUF554 domain-containing protein [Planifilum fimeticola]PRX42128.1 hypothetical protein CLV97_103143 [Planifilum fimeticola]